jgi:mannose-6-phosphate isomerase-like protein (cupin superfamily)
MIFSAHLFERGLHAFSNHSEAVRHRRGTDCIAKAHRIRRKISDAWGGVVGREGLILQPSEGERRVRRPRRGSGAAMSASAMIIKVDGRNGGSSDLFAGCEEIFPGNSIPVHSHPEYDEVLFVHHGNGLATLGSQQRMVTTGATIYIPPKTRVSLKNTGRQTLSVFFVFPPRDGVGLLSRNDRC